MCGELKLAERSETLLRVGVKLVSHDKTFLNLKFYSKSEWAQFSNSTSLRSDARLLMQITTHDQLLRKYIWTLN